MDIIQIIFTDFFFKATLYPTVDLFWNHSASFNSCFFLIDNKDDCAGDFFLINIEFNHINLKEMIILNSLGTKSV